MKIKAEAYSDGVKVNTIEFDYHMNPGWKIADYDLCKFMHFLDWNTKGLFDYAEFEECGNHHLRYWFDWEHVHACYDRWRE